MLAGGCGDLVLAVLFAMAYVQTGKEVYHGGTEGTERR
jgi:hypothetical protein